MQNEDSPVGNSEPLSSAFTGNDAEEANLYLLRCLRTLNERYPEAIDPESVATEIADATLRRQLVNSLVDQDILTLAGGRLFLTLHGKSTISNMCSTSPAAATYFLSGQLSPGSATATQLLLSIRRSHFRTRHGG